MLKEDSLALFDSNQKIFFVKMNHVMLILSTYKICIDLCYLLKCTLWKYFLYYKGYIFLLAVNLKPIAIVPLLIFFSFVYFAQCYHKEFRNFAYFWQSF